MRAAAPRVQFVVFGDHCEGGRQEKAHTREEESQYYFEHFRLESTVPWTVGPAKVHSLASEVPAVCPMDVVMSPPHDTLLQWISSHSIGFNMSGSLPTSKSVVDPIPRRDMIITKKRLGRSSTKSLSSSFMWYGQSVLFVVSSVLASSAARFSRTRATSVRLVVKDQHPSQEAMECDDGHARPRVKSVRPIEAGEQSALAPIEIRRLENIARNKQLLLRRKGVSWREGVCLQSGSRFSKRTRGSGEKRDNESYT